MILLHGTTWQRIGDVTMCLDIDPDTLYEFTDGGGKDSIIYGLGTV